jgi:hypothetical protein
MVTVFDSRLHQRAGTGASISQLLPGGPSSVDQAKVAGRGSR